MPEPDQTPVDTQLATGTPLVSQEMLDNEEEAADFRLPTNQELIDDQGKDDDNQAENKDGGGDDAAGGDNSSQGQQAKTQTPPAEEQVEYVEDPGDFAPGDHSFEVTVYDEKGANPKAVKIASPEEWYKLMETEPNLGTSGAVAKAFSAASKMEREIDGEHKDWEKRKKEFEEATKAQEAREETVNLWVREMDYLAEQGEIPPMPADLKTANWSDPAVAKQPAVKAQIEILNYMRDENQRRAKVGLKPMTSVLDAYEGFARQRDRSAAATAKTTAAEARKAAGAKVAGSAPAPASAAPRGVSVGRVVDLSN